MQVAILIMEKTTLENILKRMKVLFTHSVLQIADLYRHGELSKKFLKKGEKMVNENKGTVQGRLDQIGRAHV